MIATLTCLSLVALAAGPRIEGVARVARAGSHFEGFVRGGSAALFVEPQQQGTLAVVISLERRERSEIGSVEHALSAISCDDAVTTCLLEEKVTAFGPDRLWWIEPGAKASDLGATHELGDSPELGAAPISPSRRWIAVQSWRQKKSGLGGILEMRVLQRASGKVLRFGLDEESLRPVGWDEARGVVLVESGLSHDPPEARRAFEGELATGRLTPVKRPLDRREAKAWEALSPDGKRRRELVGERLVITELATRKQRALTLPPEERPYLGKTCCGWVSPRYLLLEAGRPLFIDTETLTLTAPLPEGEHPRLRLSPDFRFALLERDDGLFLGRIAPP